MNALYPIRAGHQGYRARRNYPAARHGTHAEEPILALRHQSSAHSTRDGKRLRYVQRRTGLLTHHSRASGGQMTGLVGRMAYQAPYY
jgi:hypothetical protein